MPNRLIFIVLTCITLAQSSFASTEPDWSALDKNPQEAVRLVRQLEDAPLASDAPATRQLLIAWVEESPNVTVTVCELLGSVPKQKVPYWPELLVQMMFANAAFQIENPSKKADLIATQTAAVASTVRTYQTIVTLQPDARIEYFEKLVDMRRNGTFESYMAVQVREKCSSAR